MSAQLSYQLESLQVYSEAHAIKYNSLKDSLVIHFNGPFGVIKHSERIWVNLIPPRLARTVDESLICSLTCNKIDNLAT